MPHEASEHRVRSQPRPRDPVRHRARRVRAGSAREPSRYGRGGVHIRMAFLYICPPLSDVLEYLASGMTEAEILADFPDLEREDIRAALAFAAERERRLVSLPPG